MATQGWTFGPLEGTGKTPPAAATPPTDLGNGWKISGAAPELAPAPPVAVPPTPSSRPTIRIMGSMGTIPGQVGTEVQPARDLRSRQTEVPPMDPQSAGAETEQHPASFYNKQPIRYGRNAKGQLVSKFDGKDWVSLFSGAKTMAPAKEETDGSQAAANQQPVVGMERLGGVPPGPGEGPYERIAREARETEASPSHGHLTPEGLTARQVRQAELVGKPGGEQAWQERMFAEQQKINGGLLPGDVTAADFLQVAIPVAAGAAGKLAASSTSAVARQSFAAADAALSAYFTYQAGKGSVQSVKEAKKAYDEGDYLGMTRQLGAAGISAAFGWWAGSNAAKRYGEVANIAKMKSALQEKVNSEYAAEAKKPAAAPKRIAPAPEVAPPPEAAPARPPAPAAAAADIGDGWTVNPIEDNIAAQERAAIAERKAPLPPAENPPGLPAEFLPPVVETPQAVAAPEPQAVPVVPANRHVAETPTDTAAPANDSGDWVRRVPYGPGYEGKFPTKDLVLDPARFQYKQEGIGGTHGVGDQFKDVTTWDPNIAGTVHVWMDPETGITHPVNGHHRTDMAQNFNLRADQSGKEQPVPEMQVRFLDAKNAKEARAMGAMINIAEGNGTALDAAKFFRDSGRTPESLAAEGKISLRKKVAEQGAALSRLPDPIFRDVVLGNLKVERAAILGAIPNQADQTAVYDMMQAREASGKRMLDDQLAELIRMNQNAPTVNRSNEDDGQGSMFGGEEWQASVLPEKAIVSEYIRKQLAAEKKLFGVVSTQAAAERLGEKGNVIQAGANAQTAEAANQGSVLYDRLSTLSGGPIDAILNRAALRIAQPAKGDTANAAKQDAYREIRDHLKGQLDKLTGVHAQSGAGNQELRQVGSDLPGGDRHPVDARGAGGDDAGAAPALPAQPVAEVAPPPAAPAESKAKLTPGLAGAKPRYAYGSKQFEVTFANDVDRAAYITAQDTPSKQDAAYLKFAMDATGLSESGVRAHGANVRAAIKAVAKDAEPGMLSVPAVEVRNATEAMAPPAPAPAPVAPNPLKLAAAKAALVVAESKAKLVRSADQIAANQKRITELEAQLKAPAPKPELPAPARTNAEAFRESDAEATLQRQVETARVENDKLKGRKPTGLVSASLRQTADNMAAQIDAKRNPATAQQNVTRRRSDIMAGMAREADQLEAIQAKLRGLADAHDAGTVPAFLRNVRTRALVEDLLGGRERFPDPFIHQTQVKDLQDRLAGKPGTKEALRRLERNNLHSDGGARITSEDDIAPIWKLAEKAEELGSTTAKYVKQELARAKRLYAAGINPANWTQAKEQLAAIGKAAPAEAPIARQIRDAERALIGRKIPGYFPTPKPVVEQMLEAAAVKPGMKVLEPSAGKGNIADAIREAEPGADLSTVEYQYELRKILEMKGHQVAGDNFLEHGGQYDRIVMNPPFENGQDVEHVQHAYELLKPGGRVVSIMGEHPFFANDKTSVAFRDWLTTHGGTSEKLEAGSFEKSERTTGVNARMVTIDKPAAEVKAAAVEPQASAIEVPLLERDLQRKIVDPFLKRPEREAGEHAIRMAQGIQQAIEKGSSAGEISARREALSSHLRESLPKTYDELTNDKLFTNQTEEAARAEAAKSQAQLTREQLTAQMKSGGQVYPSNLKPLETRSMFEEDQPESGSLFGSERGSFSRKSTKTPEQIKAESDARYGRNVREWFTSRRDLWSARVNQQMAAMKKLVPEMVDREGLFILRDFRNRPGELAQWLKGTHLAYENVSRLDIAKENIEKLRPAIERALKPTPEMLQADKVLTRIAEVSLREGQRLGFIDRHMSPDEYVTHLLEPEGQNKGIFENMGKAIGGKFGKNFPYNQERAFPTMIEAIANNQRPRTLDPFSAFETYGEKFATARATHMLIEQLRESDTGMWGTKGGKGIPKDWVEIAPHAHPFRNIGAYVTPEGEPIAGYQTLFVPPKIEAGLRPITDPDYTSKIAGFSKLRMFQSYTKAAQLGLSFFHATTENYMALASMGPTGWLKGLKADRYAPGFLEQEADFIGHGGTTAIQGRTYEAYEGLTMSSLPTATESWRSLPGIRHVDKVAQSITDITFGKLQRQFKVVDYSLHKAAWLAKHPNAMPDERAAAMRSMAKVINAVYGGLHAENLGINAMTANVARAMMLAPDWTFSNIFHAKYAFESGTPAGKMARLFWLRAVVGGLAATQLMSLLMSGKPSKRPTQAYLGTDADGKEIYQNLFFKGAPGDLATFIGNVKDYGAVVGMTKTIGNKAAPVWRTGIMAVTGKNYLGQAIVPKGMNPVAGTVRGAWEIGKGLAPIPWSAGNMRDMLWGPDHEKYKVPLEVLTTLFAGTPPSHVAPPTRGEKPQQDIWEQIMTGKSSAPTVRAPAKPVDPVQQMKRAERKELHP